MLWQFKDVLISMFNTVIAGGEYSGDDILGELIFIIGEVVLVVMMLNILIAIVSNSF